MLNHEDVGGPMASISFAFRLVNDQVTNGVVSLLSAGESMEIAISTSSQDTVTLTSESSALQIATISPSNSAARFRVTANTVAMVTPAILIATVGDTVISQTQVMVLPATAAGR